MVINEISSWDSTGDWIELYALENTDISGWILRDNANKPIKTVPGGTIIGPSTNSFYVIEAGNRLNKDSDFIKLLRSDDATVVDSIIYGESGSPCAPGQGESIGRYPDANSVIDRFSAVTKNSSNNLGTLLSCPTPTFEPTNSPAPTATSKPTDAPTLKPTYTPKPTSKTEVKAAKTDGTESSEFLSQNEEDQNLLGLRYTNTPTFFSPTPQIKGDATNNFPYTAGLLIVLGLVFLGGSFFAFLRNKKKSYDILHGLKSVDSSKGE